MVEYIIITFPSLKVMYCKTTWLIQRKFSLSFMWLLCLLWKTVGHFGYVGQLETNQTSGCVTQQKEWWEYSDWSYPVNSVDSYQAGFLDIKFPAALFRPATKQWRRSKGLLEEDADGNNGQQQKQHYPLRSEVFKMQNTWWLLTRWWAVEELQ